MAIKRYISYFFTGLVLNNDFKLSILCLFYIIFLQNTYMNFILNLSCLKNLKLYPDDLISAFNYNNNIKRFAISQPICEFKLE